MDGSAVGVILDDDQAQPAPQVSIGDASGPEGPGNDTVRAAAGNDTVDVRDGGAGTDRCTADTGDIRISCP